jgi:hypothetical protein
MRCFQPVLGCGADHSRWRGWICPACWDAWFLDRKIRRRLKKAFDLPPSPDLEARILAAMEIPPETAAAARHLPGGRWPAARRGAAILRGIARSRTGRRAVLAAISLILVIALTQRLTIESSAETVEHVLAAMAGVQTARCTGWRISYPGGTVSPPSAGVRSKVELWYRAPETDRGATEASLRGGPRPHGTVFFDHPRWVLWGTGLGPVLEGRTLLPILRPVNLFSPEEALGCAVREKRAKVRVRLKPDDPNGARLVTVEFEPLPSRARMRLRWILTVDRPSNRLARAEWSAAAWDHHTWRLREAGTLDHFDYDVPVPDGPPGVPNHERSTTPRDAALATHRQLDQRQSERARPGGTTVPVARIGDQ